MLFLCTMVVTNMNIMQINNRSLQDMYIFEDPLHIPIIIVERMANMGRSPSLNSYFNALETKANLLLENGSRATNKSRSSPQQNGQVLRVVVFVHGFQACFTSYSCLYPYIYVGILFISCCFVLIFKLKMKITFILIRLQKLSNFLDLSG